MTPAPRSRFLLDFDEQKERLIGNNKAGFQRVLTKHGFGPAESIVDDHLLAMSKDAKHALIADLKAEPPF